MKGKGAKMPRLKLAAMGSLAALLAMSLIAPAQAQENEREPEDGDGQALATVPSEPKRDTTVYAGGGPDALVGGALFDRASVAWGVDFAQEGLMTDRTGGSGGVFGDYVPNDTEKAISLNAVAALPLSLGQSAGEVMLGALLGVRTTRRECPSGQSYLGFNCYADEDPDVSYKVNGGILVA